MAAISVLIFGFLIGSGFVKFNIPFFSERTRLEVEGVIRYSETKENCWYISGFNVASNDKCGPEYRCNVPTSYEPLNLPAALKEPGIRAKFKLEVQRGVATTCQVGPVVKILDYQIVKQ